MNREQMLEKIKQAMPEKRFQHTLGVEKNSTPICRNLRGINRKSEHCGFVT